MGLGSLASALCPGIAMGQSVTGGGKENPMGASEQSFWTAPRWVWLHRQSNGSSVKLIYWRDGHLIPEAYQQLSWFLRDTTFERMMNTGDKRLTDAIRSGRISQEFVTPWMMVDPVLLDILYAYCGWLSFHGVQKPLLVTSAFRHPITNEQTEGASRSSWHMRAGAVDMTVPGVSSAHVANFGRWLQGGGVGHYVDKNFVHVDRGALRSWIGKNR